VKIEGRRLKERENAQLVQERLHAIMMARLIYNLSPDLKSKADFSATATQAFSAAVAVLRPRPEETL
jgi:hypothetical protein